MVKPLERNAVSVCPKPPTSAALELDDQYAYTERTESKILCMSADVRSLIHTRSGWKATKPLHVDVAVPLPVYGPASKYFSGTAIVGAGKLAVERALKPDGGVFTKYPPAVESYVSPLIPPCPKFTSWLARLTAPLSACPRI